MDQNSIRNVAIIAHVDHGKTTLVDQLFQQSGMFRQNEEVAERLMDSMDLERERGITITSKNGSFVYDGHWINIIDTPGHADFGGQVERVLKMADGALLLVDAEEGPMPQTYFVLKKALAQHLPIIVVVNKIDKPASRPDWVVDQVFDLFVKLHAPDDILDFPVVFASSRLGYALDDPNDTGNDLIPLCDKIITHVPPPSGNPDASLQMLVSSIDYSPYLGRLGIGKITAGALNINNDVAVARCDGSLVPARVTKVFRFEGTEKVATESAQTGEIVAVAGMDEITVGETYTDPDHPKPLPPTEVDPPTIAMNFLPNDSPFTGRDGVYVTSRHLAERLSREVLSDVALHVEPLVDGMGFKVSGRGELHLSILIERMRRDGYEFQVTSPQVILREENGKKFEPYEDLTVDVAEESVGAVIEMLGARKGQILSMETEHGMARVTYRIPTRGLLGFRSEFLTNTRGMGVMNYIFAEYGPYAGDIKRRMRGALVSMQTCTTVAYAFFNLQDRGRLFLGPGVDVYVGQIVGEHCREGDLSVNPAKGKKLSNVRASGTDDSVILTPPTIFALEDCLSFINDDELVEVTPKAIRLRKRSFRP
ncbi:MAG: translational GTPase TypA [Lentisphaerae bacterium]|jgi:GTP-binding protein|nr:translational GTPase TypA [Lentisphaerota bacterium]MBT5608775.1 translational GTPase TypA [Lentisphaerota bacterium]MBT7058286.1 translational GTPase TypA [Lentisphaerota bacterium]MBT7840261.1 translational GTPase TypA [Lentisphaerota bacterium]